MTDNPWQVVNVGLVPYPEAWRLQHRLLAARIEGLVPDTLVLLEHPHVYTFGRRAVPEHLLLTPAQLAERGVETVWVDRGGDITYHGPGQRVAYAMLDLSRRRQDVRAFVGALEDWLIDALADVGVRGTRRAERVEIGRAHV